MLAIAFAVTEAWVLRFRRRGSAATVSLSEIPLVLGLFLAVPHDLLLGRVLGSAVVLVAYRRQPAVKAAFGTALAGAGTAAAVAGFGVLAPTQVADALGPWAWLAAVVAVVLGGLLDAARCCWSAAGTPARSASGRRYASWRWSVAVPAVLGLLGVGAVTLVHQQGSILPVGTVGVVALLAYRAFASLSQRHATLEQLYRLSDQLAGASDSREVVGLVLRQAGDLLRAGYAEILLPEDGDAAETVGDRRASSRRTGRTAQGSG